MFFSSESNFMQQSCIIHQMETRDCIVVISLLVHFCQSRLIGPNKPIIATGGEDITLPCHLVPGENVAEMTFEWTRPDLEPRFVFVWRTRQDLVAMKNPSYKDRSSLFTDELKHGNISLKLSKVKPADEGRYRCYIPAKDEEAFIDLVVASGAVSSPVISLEGIDRDKTGVMLECKSGGWHPEPELLWLDGEGNLLSAGPTETLRGPDDLYTVSSRVTVEKRHSNNITCRVQQRNTNQIRETQKHVSDELFQLTSSSTAPVIIGVVVSLAVIILILIGVFFLWRRNKKKKKNPFKGDQTETDQEQQTLMTQDIKPVSDMTESDKTTKHEEKPETNKKLKEDEKQDFQQEKQTNVKVVNPKSPQEHESPRRTNTGTIETLTQMRAKDSPGGGHSAGTEQKPQASVAMSSQAQPADGCTRADRPLSPETQDPRAPHTPTEARPSSCEEEKQEADKMFKKIDKKQDFQQEAKQPDVTEVVNPQNTPELEIPRRTNTCTIVAPTQTRAEERPGWRRPAGTEQKPQESVAMSSQAQPAADCTRADRPLSPETRDPRAPHTPTDARPSSCQLHEEKQEAEKKVKEDETQDFQQEVKQPSIKERMKQFEENQQSPPDIDTPRKTTTGKIKTPTQMRAKDSPGGGHPPDTEQKPHRSVAMSSQAQLADSCTRADRPLGPETQDPRAHHTPSGARQSQGVQARSSSCQLEKNQHAAEEKLKEEHHHLQKKHAEISNMKKEEENQEADKMLKDDKKQDFQQEAKQPDITEVERPQKTPEHETPKGTNTCTFVATNETRAKESPGWRHPAGTEHKPQQSAVTSSQAQPAAGCTTADRPLSPETQDPRAPHTLTGAHQSQGGQTRPSSCQEQKQEAEKKLKEDKKQDFLQQDKKTPTKEFWKQLEKKQEAEKKMKEEHHHLQKKHAEISNMKKEEKKKEADTKLEKDEKQNFQQEIKQLNVKEHVKEQQSNKPNTPQRGDIILDEVDRHGHYICLKNTSSEDKLMAGWKLKLQSSNRISIYTFKENFALKAGEELTVRGEGGRNPYPDNAEVMWVGMIIWDSLDKLKIDLISSTEERRRLK